jgi:hypothetical protein
MGCYYTPSVSKEEIHDLGGTIVFVRSESQYLKFDMAKSVQNTYFWDPHIPKLRWYHSLIIVSLYLFLCDMIGYVGSKMSLMNIERRVISKALQYINKFIKTTFIKIK